MSTILFSRTIGPVPISVVLREEHFSGLGITTNPIETGAEITDHAYREPKRLVLDFADENAAATWNALVAFQESRVPFTIVTGLAIYQDMLIRELHAERDSQFSRILNGNCILQEVILVSTAVSASDGEGGATSKGKAGGKNSTQSAAPSKERAGANGVGTAGNRVTQDRASGVVGRGDAPVKAVAPDQNRSILHRMFN